MRRVWYAAKPIVTAVLLALFVWGYVDLLCWADRHSPCGALIVTCVCAGIVISAGIATAVVYRWKSYKPPSVKQ